ncbi:Entericidin EcnAB [Thiocystis violacea]|uniref:Entericidin EcnAB n=1 Tax=Thiocystis violacea TaxID=13725 RepID=UPI001908D568|nr:Entericidin EcnAB [Thiocystis violacea]
MRHVITQSTWLLLLLFPLTIALTGCNTMAGVGEDLGAAGGGLEKSAEREKGY